jgi:hypothetical protein
LNGSEWNGLKEVTFLSPVYTATTGFNKPVSKTALFGKEGGEKRGIREFVCQEQRDKYRIPK